MQSTPDPIVLLESRDGTPTHAFIRFDLIEAIEVVSGHDECWRAVAIMTTGRAYEVMRHPSRDLLIARLRDAMHGVLDRLSEGGDK